MRSRACEPGCPLEGADVCGEDFPDTVGSASCCMEPEGACPPDAASTGDHFLPLFRRVARRMAIEEARASEERRTAEALYEELMSLPAGSREHAVEHQERYVSFALAERLLAASLRARFERPEASLDLTRLALSVADRLDAGRFGRGLVADLRARSWAYLGDAWTASAPPAAREAFRLARLHLGRGSGDPLEEAEVLTLTAGSAEASDGADVALDHLDRAGEIYRATGEARRVGETLVRKARLAGRVGRHLEAAGLLREAQGILRDLAPASELAELGTDAARHLEAADRAEEAWTELARARQLLARKPAPRLRARLRWIEGRIAARMGLDDEARGHLTKGRDGLLAAGDMREAVAAHLDLAALAARAGAPSYPGTMERLADETRRLVLSGDLRREETTVLLLLDQAAQKQALQPDLVAALSGYLARVA